MQKMPANWSKKIENIVQNDGSNQNFEIWVPNQVKGTAVSLFWNHKSSLFARSQIMPIKSFFSLHGDRRFQQLLGEKSWILSNFFNWNTLILMFKILHQTILQVINYNSLGGGFILSEGDLA